MVVLLHFTGLGKSKYSVGGPEEHSTALIVTSQLVKLIRLSGQHDNNQYCIGPIFTAFRCNSIYSL